MASGAWARFEESFFGNAYMAWHDGLDRAAVHSLGGEEKERAEQMMIDALETGEYRPIVGLGELRSQKAIPKLKELLDKSTSNTAISIAVALNKIENTNKYSELIRERLKNDPSWYTRLQAAMELGYAPDEESINQLYVSVEDPDYLVRFHSCNSLLKIHGIKKEIQEFENIFENLTYSDAEVNDGAPTEADKLRFKTAVGLTFPQSSATIN